MNILILSVGTRCQLVKYFKSKENGFDKVITTDCSEYSPALYFSDSYYIVPLMTDDTYISVILNICKKEKINVLLPLQEDELELISRNRCVFEKLNILTVVSELNSLKICRDKFSLYQHLKKNNVNCINTYISVSKLNNESFPVFVKPRYGSGSVGALKINSLGLLKEYCCNCSEELIIQPFMDAIEYGADVYVDFISKKVSSIFLKRKIRMRAGETEKAVSVTDTGLFEFISKTLATFDLTGPIDIDLFFYNGKYYILEINPRFGGGYPHAYECGINFPLMICENAKGKKNNSRIGEYKEKQVLLKYTTVMVKNEKDMF